MPLDTVLCLDTSGSMGMNNGINELKAAAFKFLDGVEETAKQANLKVGRLNKAPKIWLYQGPNDRITYHTDLEFLPSYHEKRIPILLSKVLDNSPSWLS